MDIVKFAASLNNIDGHQDMTNWQTVGVDWWVSCCSEDEKVDGIGVEAVGVYSYGYTR